MIDFILKNEMNLDKAFSKAKTIGQKGTTWIYVKEKKLKIF